MMKQKNIYPDLRDLGILVTEDKNDFLSFVDDPQYHSVIWPMPLEKKERLNALFNQVAPLPVFGDEGYIRRTKIRDLGFKKNYEIDIQNPGEDLDFPVEWSPFHIELKKMIWTQSGASKQQQVSLESLPNRNVEREFIKNDSLTLSFTVGSEGLVIMDHRNNLHQVHEFDLVCMKPMVRYNYPETPNGDRVTFFTRALEFTEI